MHSQQALLRIETVILLAFVATWMLGGLPNIRANTYFVPEMQINDVSLGVQASPSIAAFPNGSFGIAWHDSRNQTGSVRDYDIYFATLDPHEIRVSESIRINNDAGQADQTYPRIAIGDDGLIHVVWVDTSTTTSLIYYSKSTDGVNFAPSKPVNVSAHAQIHPAMALDSAGNPHVVWADLREGDVDIYYTYSSNRGNSYEQAVRIDKDPGTANQLNPQIAMGPNGSAWIAWTDYRNDADGKWFDFGGSDGHNDGDVYLRCLCDGSGTPEIRVNQDQHQALQAPGSISVSENSALVAWTDYRNDADGYPVGWPPYGGIDGVDDGDIYVAAVTEDGSSVKGELRVNNDGGLYSQGHPSLAAKDGRVHVTWSDRRDQSRNWDVYYAESPSSNLDFSKNVRVSGDAGNTSQTYPSIAVSGKLAVVWADDRIDTEMDVFGTLGEEHGAPPETPLEQFWIWATIVVVVILIPILILFWKRRKKFL